MISAFYTILFIEIKLKIELILGKLGNKAGRKRNRGGRRDNTNSWW